MRRTSGYFPWAWETILGSSKNLYADRFNFKYILALIGGIFIGGTFGAIFHQIIKSEDVRVTLLPPSQSSFERRREADNLRPRRVGLVCEPKAAERGNAQESEKLRQEAIREMSRLLSEVVRIQKSLEIGQGKRDIYRGWAVRMSQSRCPRNRYYEYYDDVGVVCLFPEWP